ncbi:MAG: NUDIX hydrolase [candidate division KSB1 bacterium]|nr:NUDIX hydrolase [candidate division KSB1 bacterium]MDZ7272813.1 NUDIX hydrolase [candidate division KSB1 bacterium]MDZ7284163.1 NUDIX hydrolase [candidate division KSB1 bacterium]MDZ7297439.1 NUDIX hydrolase [candidate division KSB1 bacterium]MDZ7308187.1 NUDIX hydrolase [candidate division KSB1 bacterium]
MTAEPQWLSWAKQIQAIAQNGLAFSSNPFDQERYQALQRLAAEIIAGHALCSREHLAAMLAEEKGYATPKVDVRCVAFRAGRILLVQEKHDGKWALPGGWADAGLAPSEAALKELREETGFTGIARKIIAVYDRRRHCDIPHLFDTYKIFVQCDLLDGEFQPNLETRAADFFSLEELPPLSEGRTTRANLVEAFEHLKNPSRPTAFD